MSIRATRNFILTLAASLGLAAAPYVARADSTLLLDVYSVNVQTDPAPPNPPINAFTTSYSGRLAFSSNSFSYAQMDTGSALGFFDVGSGTMGAGGTGFQGYVDLVGGVIQDGQVTFRARAAASGAYDSYTVSLAHADAAHPTARDIGGGTAPNGLNIDAFTIVALTYNGDFALNPSSPDSFAGVDVTPWMAQNGALQGGLYEFNFTIDPKTGLAAIAPGTGSLATSNAELFTTVSAVPLPSALWAGGSLLGLLVAASRYRRLRGT